jgi:hypothetical protein
MKIKQLNCTVKISDITASVYEPPKLRVFGPVGKLTQAGSGADSELMTVGGGTMVMDVCSNSPNAQSAMC